MKANLLTNSQYEYWEELLESEETKTKIVSQTSEAFYNDLSLSILGALMTIDFINDDLDDEYITDREKFELREDLARELGHLVDYCKVFCKYFTNKEAI